MKKIMFNDKYGLTEAVLQGRKTMMRRIVTDYEFNQWDGRQIMLGYDPESNTQEYGLLSDDGSGEVVRRRLLKYPYRCGEVLAVAQSYKDAGYNVEWVVYNIHPNPRSKVTDPMSIRYPGWNNKMFVRADVMPHQIRITDIKVKRLQDISDEDCMREGVQEFDTPVGKCYVAGGVYVGQDSRLKIAKGMINIAKPFKTPQEAFAVLIDKVSGKGTWKSNPWVFAFSFELLK